MIGAVVRTVDPLTGLPDLLLPDLKEFSWDHDLDAPSGGTFVYPRAGINASLLKPKAPICVLIDNAAPRNGYFMLQEAADDVVAQVTSARSSSPSATTSSAASCSMK